MRLTRMNGTRRWKRSPIPGGDLITPEVGAQVVRFVAGGRLRPTAERPTDDGLAELEVEPSLLSLVCRELNNRRLALGLPQITADLLAGNRERILQDFYERCVADQPPAVRAFVEDELVTDSGLRENMALERAAQGPDRSAAPPPRAIDELVKRRLLHLEDRLDIQRVELTHDVLTSVVKKSRDERQQQEAMLRAEQRPRPTAKKPACSGGGSARSWRGWRSPWRSSAVSGSGATVFTAQPEEPARGRVPAEARVRRANSSPIGPWPRASSCRAMP